MKTGILLLLLSLAVSVSIWSAPIAEHLRTEYLENPLAIDTAVPRLTWLIDSPEREQRQTAYRILVASTPELLAANTGELWDTGKFAATEADVLLDDKRAAETKGVRFLLIEEGCGVFSVQSGSFFTSKSPFQKVSLKRGR